MIKKSSIKPLVKKHVKGDIKEAKQLISKDVSLMKKISSKVKAKAKKK